MAQINITLNQEEIIEVLSKNRDEAFKMIVQKILNQIMLAESREQLQAEPYERSESRTDSRNGMRERNLTTRIGQITLQVPRHRNVPFKSMIFDNYSRSEAALIASMVEMVIAGISTRKVTKVTELLCGKSFSKSMVSELCKSLDEIVSEFQNRRLDTYYPFLITDATYFKVRENHRVVSKAFMIAMGIREDGIKEIIGFGVYDSENKGSWEQFYRSLVKRGLQKPKMITSDAHQGEKQGIGTVFPTVAWQRCQVHFRKNILDNMPRQYMAGLGAELTEMFQAETIEEARRIKNEIVADYSDVAEGAMDILEDGFEDAMTVMALPKSMRMALRSSNHLERQNGELRARGKIIKLFPNEASLNRLMGAVLMEIHDAMITRTQGIFPKRSYERMELDSEEKLIQIAEVQHLNAA